MDAARSFAQAGAQAEWDSRAPAWTHAVDDWGPWIVAAIGVALIVRALWHHRRYRATTVFGRIGQVAVHDALVAAEARTVGEIVPVVLERSDRHPSADWLSAVATMMVGTALLQDHLPWTRPHELLGCQIAMGCVGFALSCTLPAWKRMFVSEARATEMANEQALQEFHRLRLHETTGRTGVLLFVSLLERRVVVLADVGIHAKAGSSTWDAAREAVLAGARCGSVDAGLVEGIRLAGAQLETHFPWTSGDRNEIPDRVVVRHE